MASRVAVRVLGVAPACLLASACSTLIDIPDRYVAAADAAIDAASAPIVDAGFDAAFAPLVDAGMHTDFVRGPLVDFNGDGYADYAEHTLSTGVFRIFLGARGGAFTASGTGIACAPGSPPACDVMLGDFDGDGLADYAEHDPASGVFEIHRNTGALAFDASVWGRGQTCTTEQAPCGALVADLTGDGFVDFADYSVMTGTFTIHENKHDGTFAPPGSRWGGPNVTGCGITATCQVVVANVDGDRFADYIALNTSGQGSVPIARGGGEYYVHSNLKDGTFSPVGDNWGIGFTCIKNRDALGESCDVLFGDFDGDGYADEADRSTHSGTLSVYLNRKPTDRGIVTTDQGGVVPAFTLSTCTGPDCEILGHRTTP
jgi:hypothetical protein